MKRAVDNNMYIVTHIHLDDGMDKGTWRNAMIFNPNQKYGALSFWEAVGKPTALAIKDANYKKRDVYYAMQVGRGWGGMPYFQRLQQGKADARNSVLCQELDVVLQP